MSGVVSAIIQLVVWGAKVGSVGGVSGRRVMTRNEMRIEGRDDGRKK